MKNLQKINKEYIKSISEILYYIFIIVCFIVGFSPWLSWTKYHIQNEQSLMVIFDIIFIFIIVPINGFIVIIKMIFGLFFNI